MATKKSAPQAQDFMRRCSRRQDRGRPRQLLQSSPLVGQDGMTPISEAPAYQFSAAKKPGFSEKSGFLRRRTSGELLSGCLALTLLVSVPAHGSFVASSEAISSRTE